jgi:ABC-2 type transport system permease protein
MGMVLAVFRKEFLEIVADRQSFRGTALQGAIFFVLCGLFLPWRSASGEMWSSLSTMLTLYGLLPTVIATSVAADAFAGELERGTLESLLATAVSDAAVFWGKALMAVAMSTSLCAACLLSAAFVTVEVHKLPLGILDLPVILLVLLGHIAICTCMTAIAIYVSVRLKVARAAQQALSVGTLVSIFGLNAAAPYLSAVQWQRVAAGELVILLVGCMALAAMTRFFRRDRIFEGA